jgi:hypothetical protein
MSYVMWEEDVNEVQDIRDQLQLFVDMAYTSKELTLTGRELGCFMNRLVKDLDSVLKIVEERGNKAHKAYVRPYTLAQIIRTIAGLEPIRGSDKNKITHELREFAAINEDMHYARDAWEEFLTMDGGHAITTLENFCVQYDRVKADATAPEGEMNEDSLTLPPDPYRAASDDDAMLQLNAMLNALTLDIGRMYATLHGLSLVIEHEEKPAKISDNLINLVDVSMQRATEIDNTFEEIRQAIYFTFGEGADKPSKQA